MDGKSPLHRTGKTADLPIYPTTPMEILLLAILCCISVAVIAYMMVVLYRLRTVSSCPRNTSYVHTASHFDLESLHLIFVLFLIHTQIYIGLKSTCYVIGVYVPAITPNGGRRGTKMKSTGKSLRNSLQFR